MKREGNLYSKIISIENLQLADANAQKGKSTQYGIRLHNKGREENIKSLHETLAIREYKTSEYTVFKIHEPKERLIFKLPYFPDRIVHHAIMNVLKPIFINCFTTDTYSCINGRGIHGASRAIIKSLTDQPNTKYCLKLDIEKFYPSVDNEILKSLLRRKFKDKDLMCLLDEIIDSAEGLPIGNYLSQYFANFYLTYFDHWIKEIKKVNYYFRYADDIVILSSDKSHLHELLFEIDQYLKINLNLEIKSNYQIFPVEARGIDFVGYKFYHSHTLLRKSIKKRFAKKMKNNPTKSTLASYYGWAKHCDSKHLLKKLVTQ